MPSKKRAAERRSQAAEAVEPAYVWPWLLLFMLVGAALRIATINWRGLWLDEASMILQVTGTLLQTIQSQIGGTHPPLFHVLMHVWVSWFGTSAIAIRSLSTVFGVASIPVAYWAGKTVYGRRVGIIAAGILTFSPFHIWYSQEARMYSMVIFWGLLSVGFFARALDKNDFRNWAGYVLVSLAGAFTQYLFLLLLMGQGIYYLFFEIVDREIKLGRKGERQFSRTNLRGLLVDVPTLGSYLFALAAMAAPNLVWLNSAVFFPRIGHAVLVGAVTTSGLGYGAPRPSLAIRFNDVVETIAEVIVGSHNQTAMSGFVAMWPIAIYLALLAMTGGRYLTRRTTMMLCSAAGVFVVWGLGQWQGVVLLSRYLTPMIPPALLLLASALSQMRPRARHVVLTIGLVLCLFAYATQAFDTNSVLRYSDREVAQYVGANAQRGDVIIYQPFYIDVLVNYYLPRQLVAYGFPRFGAKGQFRDARAEIFQDLARIVGPARRVWVIRAFQNVPSIGYESYLVDTWFNAHDFKLGEHVILNKAEWLRYDSTAATPTAGGGGATP